MSIPSSAHEQMSVREFAECLFALCTQDSPKKLVELFDRLGGRKRELNLRLCYEWSLLKAYLICQAVRSLPCYDGGLFDEALQILYESLSIGFARMGIHEVLPDFDGDSAVRDIRLRNERYYEESDLGKPMRGGVSGGPRTGRAFFSFMSGVQSDFMNETEMELQASAYFLSVVKLLHDRFRDVRLIRE